jgi:hypothetical protein
MKQAFIFLIFIPVFCFGQGFGFEDETGQGSSFLSSALNINGEIEVGPLFFVHDFKKGADSLVIEDFVNAKLNFDVNGKNASAFIGLNLSYSAFEELKDGDFTLYPPALVDEMWLRGYFDRLSVQAGLIKVRWGRMYSPGPLDIVNPLDYSDLTNLTESKDMKIARPMVYASYKVNDFSGIEAVFLPNFAPHRFAQDGRWVPGQYSNIAPVFIEGIFNRALQINPSFIPVFQSLLALPSGSSLISYEFPDTSTLDYFQTGLRFNTVIGPCDLGFQYFYGNYMRPSVSLNGVDDFINSVPPLLVPPSPNIEYTRYHQIGVDYSQVLFGFTLRAEFAAHITGDVRGDNGNVKNPFLAWSLGFDRDIFAGLNINLQYNGIGRLLDNKVIKNPALDCEGASENTSTRLILQISKNFFRDRLECKVVNIWDIEGDKIKDSGAVIIPSVAWSVNDTRVELSAGIFAGDEKSELGQYWENSYIKLKLIYSF